MARRDPLIWLQLLGAAALPLEVLLLLLLLAGADPGPVPALERLLAWGLGALVPALLLWKRPADPLSLVLLQTPLQSRSPEQRTLAAGPLLPLQLAAVAAAALLLPALWWIDRSAALATSSALLPEANRLVALLLAAAVLALIVWQLQQLTQALLLLRRSPEAWAQLSPLSSEQIRTQRLCLGLPLLRLPPLRTPLAVAVEPEQPPEDAHRTDLNQQVD